MNDDDNRPFNPVWVFITAMIAGTILIAGVLFAHDLFIRFVPGM